MDSSLSRRPALVDAGIAILAFVVSLGLIHGLVLTHTGHELNTAGALLAAATTFPLVFWRMAPLWVFAISSAGAVLASALAYALDIPVGATVALYLVAANRSTTKPWTRGLTALVIGFLIVYLGVIAIAFGSWPVLQFIHTAMAWAIAWFAGERSRLRREQMAELRERAIAAENAAESDRLLAVAEERARIARDLHDSAGHAINVIAVRAGAARLTHGIDPDRSLAALREIEEVARHTAEEVDGIVHALRDADAARPAPTAPAGLASLSTLVGQHSRSGLEVAVEPRGDRRSLSPASDQAAYRLLQEALTNAARHGSGDARVELIFDVAALKLIVTNPAAPHTKPNGAGGHGLIGMKERARLIGGNLDAAWIDGSFRVSATIPYEAQRA